MGLDRGFEFFGLGVLRHLWQCFQDLLLGVIQVLESVEEEIVQGLLFGSYSPS
jgi:hypothetical protein